MGLTGTTVAVTGAGRGLGLTLVRTLLDQDAEVVANYRSPSEELEKLAAADPRLRLVPGDIGEPDTSDAIVRAALDGFGRLDSVVHNAGITRDGALALMTVEDWDEVMRVNLRGAFLLTRAAVRVMMRRRSGRFVYLSSVSAVMGNAGQANYAAAKAGLNGLSQAVAQEYGRFNIGSVVIAPGLLDTGMTDLLPAKVLEQKTARSLVGVCDAAAVAELVAFLAGPAGRVVNATVVRADGGIVY